MKKIILATLLLAVFLFFVWRPYKKTENILYSWSMSALEDPQLESVLKKHNIGILYQDFSSAYLKGTDFTFLKNMRALKVDVYHLSGDPSWGEDAEAKSMKEEIDKVVAYNANNEEKISGIVFDVEPYLHNKEKFDFPLYVEAMKEAYQYAKEQGIYMVLALAVWFDTLDENLLEELIQDGCDEISLMNYNIEYTKERMEEEMKFAKKYNKKVNTIYEIDFGKDGYFESYEAIDHDFWKLKQYYRYPHLKKAYHYYDKMK